jgi:hypothetical protein
MKRRAEAGAVQVAMPSARVSAVQMVAPLLPPKVILAPAMAAPLSLRVSVALNTPLERVAETLS